jgi:hypothetical protein
LTTEHPLCPRCNQPVSFGDGVETPPLYCPDCELGWDTPNELEYYRSILDELVFDPTPDDEDLDGDADLDAVEQWMHDPYGQAHQGGLDPDDLDESF